jgi:hypothetical protein
LVVRPTLPNLINGLANGFEGDKGAGRRGGMGGIGGSCWLPNLATVTPNPRTTSTTSSR